MKQKLGPRTPLFLVNVLTRKRLVYADLHPVLLIQKILNFFMHSINAPTGGT